MVVRGRLLAYFTDSADKHDAACLCRYQQVRIACPGTVDSSWRLAAFAAAGAQSVSVPPFTSNESVLKNT